MDKPFAGTSRSGKRVEALALLPAMVHQLQPAAPALVTAVAGELVDPGGLAARAAEVAARQRSAETRRTYATVYRAFGAFLGPDATPTDLTPQAVRACRDALELAGRSPATVAKHLSALRGLAEALGVETQQLRTVRSARVGRGEPRALTHDEWARLLRMPDRRTRQGERDLALLHLLGSVGLRRAEAVRLLVTDEDERRRASDPRLRHAIKGSTAWWAIMRYGKRGRTRAVPLDDDALEAIVACVKSRPRAASEHLLLSLPRSGPPRPLSTRDVARIVARHAATADLPDDRRSPHVGRAPVDGVQPPLAARWAPRFCCPRSAMACSRRPGLTAVCRRRRRRGGCRRCAAARSVARAPDGMGLRIAFL